MLKIIAAISMCLDHIGYIFFPRVAIFRIIGRIAFPIFAYMIAEGCKHSRHKLRYFLTVFIVGTVCQVVYYIAMQDIYMNILLTFSLSIVLIYSLQLVKKCFDLDKSLLFMILSGILFMVLVVGVFFLTYYVRFDYGFLGAMLPVFVSLFHSVNMSKPYLLDNKLVSVITFSIGLVLMCLFSHTVYRYFSLISIVFVLLYSGNRGKLKMKYFFYLFYPLHLALLYVIAMLI